tara:strand:- start:459 stop:704 length:246 start_codon:yes stop_codon:yes gene_type:complete
MNDKWEKARELKASNFKRIAERRTNEILDMLSKLAKLGNNCNYVYSEEQTKQIIQAIESKLKFVEESFNGWIPVKKQFELR